MVFRTQNCSIRNVWYQWGITHKYTQFKKVNQLKDKIIQHLSHRIENDELTNNDLVQIIEHLGSYLNLATIADYAKRNNLSYNGVKNHRKTTTIFNVKFVTNNL